MKRVTIVLLLIALVGVGARAYYTSTTGQQAVVSTARVAAGHIVDVVDATGTLQAVTTVQVGTQVSGTVSWLGADFNSIVRKGDVIARLDPSLLDAQIAQVRANLARASADVENARVQVADAQVKYERAQVLSQKSLLARSELDAARVAVDTEQAQLKSALAQLIQAEASLSQSEVTRQHATITAPIDGIVIQRSVDVGQTVAASLQSPTIFSIAADLARMQVQASIDESDIGKIAPGQAVSFTVDAYPAERFTGVTRQVRLQPTVVQNVTTYTVIVDVPNAELKLKPGMTATVSIEIARRDDVVTVPNAALRFTPSTAALAALGVTTGPAAEPARAGRGAKVWVRENGVVRSVAVKTGLSDGQATELLSGDLAPGTEVVTNVLTASDAARPTAAAPTGGMFMGGSPAGGPGLGGQGGNRQGATRPAGGAR